MGQSGVDIVYCDKCVFHMGYLSCKEFILWTWMDIYVSVLYKNRHICLFLRPFNISDIWNYESIIFLRKYDFLHKKMFISALWTLVLLNIRP